MIKVILLLCSILLCLCGVVNQNIFLRFIAPPRRSTTNLFPSPLKYIFLYLTDRYVPQSTSAPPYGGSADDRISTSTNWAILLYPEPTKSTEDVETYKTPSMLPVPPPIDDDDDVPTGNGGGQDTNANYMDYDQKWNEGEVPEEEEPPEVTEFHAEKSMPGTMVLVIGIILGAFIAMILIVIFVLKIRVRVDGLHVKCEEAAPRYQFAPPNDYGELGGEQETATTSLMEGSVAPPVVATGSNSIPPGNGRGPPGSGAGGPPVGGMLPAATAGMYNNGMFNNNCNAPASQQPRLQPPPPSSNGDRSRLFRKSNGSKPVREWYV